MAEDDTDTCTAFKCWHCNRLNPVFKGRDDMPANFYFHMFQWMDENKLALVCSGCASIAPEERGKKNG